MSEASLRLNLFENLRKEANGRQNWYCEISVTDSLEELLEECLDFVYLPSSFIELDELFGAVLDKILIQWETLAVPNHFPVDVTSLLLHVAVDGVIRLELGVGWEKSEVLH